MAFIFSQVYQTLVFYCTAKQFSGCPDSYKRRMMRLENSDKKEHFPKITVPWSILRK